MLGMPFDPQAELLIEERIRPHWSQAGAIVFVTFRTFDSIPKEVIQRWDYEKNHWIWHLGYPPKHWSELLSTLSEKEQSDFRRHFVRTREDFLDTCQEKCLLGQQALAEIVGDSLLHFDGDRYRMGDFVVMPNHVHLLAAFANPDQMRTQFDSWLHYTAVQINREISGSGRFWQPEPFDHLVRNSQQYEYLRDYIAKNPQKANLPPGQFLYRRYAR